MQTKSRYVDWIHSLSRVAKFSLLLFLDPFVGGFYRFCRGQYLFGFFWLITGGIFIVGWLIDLVGVVMYNRIGTKR